MNYYRFFSKHWVPLLIAVIFFLTSSTFPIRSMAIEAEGITPQINDVIETFSDNFCSYLEDGLTPEKSGESAAGKMASGLMFSPVMGQIMEAPKESLASTLSENIYVRCGSALGASQEELNDYLKQLATKIPKKSKSSFPIVKQRRAIEKT